MKPLTPYRDWERETERSRRIFDWMLIAACAAAWLTALFVRFP